MTPNHVTNNLESKDYFLNQSVISAHSRKRFLGAVFGGGEVNQNGIDYQMSQINANSVKGYRNQRQDQTIQIHQLSQVNQSSLSILGNQQKL